MRIHLYTSTLVLLAMSLNLPACRTAADGEEVSKQPLPLTAPADTSKSPVLKKSLGAITTKYPENKVSECLIVEVDVPNLKDIQEAIATLKTQPLNDAFIFRAQIPSIQYFAYLGGEELLILETGDEKTRYRQPNSLGNPALDTLMAIFDAKCGA